MTQQSNWVFISITARLRPLLFQRKTIHGRRRTPQTYFRRLGFIECQAPCPCGLFGLVSIRWFGFLRILVLPERKKDTLSKEEDTSSSEEEDAMSSLETASEAVQKAEAAREAISDAVISADATLEWASQILGEEGESESNGGEAQQLKSRGKLLRPFKLERYFAQYEFSAPHLLCCSDAESLTLKELLNMNSENGEAGAELQSKWEELSLGYTESRGDPLLLAEISNLYGDAVAPEGPNAPVVMAPQEGVFVGMKAMLEPVSPGDAVVCMSPGYQSLYGVAEALGCDLIKWQPESETDGGESRKACPAHFSIATLKELLANAVSAGRKIRAVVVNFPHNPTGFLPSLESFRELVDICRSLDCYFFCDEMYRNLEMDAERCLPSAVDMGYARAIALCGVSKALSLPGLRIGWLVSTSIDFLHRVTELHDYTTICNSAPSEVLALMALRCRERILSRNRTIVEENLALLRPFFQRQSARFAWHEPIAGTVCFPRLLTPMARVQDAPGETAAGAAAPPAEVNVTEYCKWLVETHGIMLLPSSVYDDFDVPCFRLGFGRNNMKAALELWEATLQ